MKKRPNSHIRYNYLKTATNCKKLTAGSFLYKYYDSNTVPTVIMLDAFPYSS